MAVYRVCRSFTVESGHMLSKHREACRFPHGHTRRIEIVVAADSLDENDMVVDFKALKLMVQDHVELLDHSMAINVADPLLPCLKAIHPDSVVVFDQDPTTEVLAKYVYDYVKAGLERGFTGVSNAGNEYRVSASTIRIERVRVWETPSSWAEYGD